MKRQELEHVLRAAGSVAQCDEIVVLGSQAILGSYPVAPDELLVSMEADVSVPQDPEKADLIEGSIGELSPFHETFGYYAHGMHIETAVLAPGWRDRLVRIESPNTGGVKGLCLHPVDIAISKLAAGRPKDLEYVAIMLSRQMTQPDVIKDLLADLEPDMQQAIMNRLSRLVPH